MSDLKIELNCDFLRKIGENSKFRYKSSEYQNFIRISPGFLLIQKGMVIPTCSVSFSIVVNLVLFRVKVKGQRSRVKGQRSRATSVSFFVLTTSGFFFVLTTSGSFFVLTTSGSFFVLIFFRVDTFRIFFRGGHSLAYFVNKSCLFMYKHYVRIVV